MKNEVLLFSLDVLLDPDLRFGTKAKLTTSVVFAHEQGDGVVCMGESTFVYGEFCLQISV